MDREAHGWCRLILPCKAACRPPHLSLPRPAPHQPCLSSLAGLQHHAGQRLVWNLADHALLVGDLEPHGAQRVRQPAHAQLAVCSAISSSRGSQERAAIG